MSVCTRQITKPVKESYIKCDKCGEEITGQFSQFGLGIPLVMKNQMIQTIIDPNDNYPTKTNVHDLCPECYKKFIHWLDNKEE